MPQPGVEQHFHAREDGSGHARRNGAGQHDRPHRGQDREDGDEAAAGPHHGSQGDHRACHEADKGARGSCAGTVHQITPLGVNATTHGSQG